MRQEFIPVIKKKRNVGMLHLNKSSGIINTQRVRRQPEAGAQGRATNAFCQVSERGRQVSDRKKEGSGGGGGGEEQRKQT